MRMAEEAVESRSSSACLCSKGVKRWIWQLGAVTKKSLALQESKVSNCRNNEVILVAVPAPCPHPPSQLTSSSPLPPSSDGFLPCSWQQLTKLKSSGMSLEKEGKSHHICHYPNTNQSYWRPPQYARATADYLGHCECALIQDRWLRAQLALTRGCFLFNGTQLCIAEHSNWPQKSALSIRFPKLGLSNSIWYLMAEMSLLWNKAHMQAVSTPSISVAQMKGCFYI